MLTEKSAGSSFTGSLPCGMPSRLPDPAAVELAARAGLRGLWSSTAEAFSSVVPPPPPPATARLIVSAIAAIPRIRGLARCPSIVPPLRSLPFAVVRARRLFLPFLVRRLFYQPLSQTFVHVKLKAAWQANVRTG